MLLTARKKDNKTHPNTILLGYFLIFLSIIIVLLTFYPVALAELNYRFYRLPENYIVTSDKEKIKETVVISPIDADFGIVIPKINANAPIVANVDPENEKEYQQKLTKGIAHAKGTAFPEDNGNMFLFAHSAADFYRANRYNAVFYLIGKLEKDDEIYIFKDNKRYIYAVTNKKIVDPNQVSYLKSDNKKKVLTLMTCWPPGTTFKRLIIEGEMVSL